MALVNVNFHLKGLRGEEEGGRDADEHKGDGAEAATESEEPAFNPYALRNEAFAPILAIMEIECGGEEEEKEKEEEATAIALEEQKHAEK